MGIIDYRDSRPIYEQIAEHYKRLILRGILVENEQMPSVRSLAMELSTNPNTIQKAYGHLETDGFIYSVKGKGNFVSNSASLLQNRRAELIQRLANLLQEIKELELDPTELYKEAMKNL